MRMTDLKWTGAALLLALAACGGSDEAQPKASAAAEGREETRLIRNTANIGYDGNAIGAKVDGALQASEDRPEQLQKSLDEQTGGE